jgi:hypothetical protein
MGIRIPGIQLRNFSGKCTFKLRSGSVTVSGSIFGSGLNQSGSTTVKETLNLLGGSVVLDQLAILHVESGADAVNLLVDLGSVEVSLLTGPEKC